MSTYKELAEHLEAYFKNAHRMDEVIAILRSLDAQRSESEPLHVASIYHLAQTSGISTQRWHNKGDAAVFSTGLSGVAKDDFINVMRRAYELGRADAAPVAAQPPSQPVDPVHVINTAIDAMMRRDATIAGVPVGANLRRNVDAAMAAGEKA